MFVIVDDWLQSKVSNIIQPMTKTRRFESFYTWPVTKLGVGNVVTVKDYERWLRLESDFPEFKHPPRGPRGDEHCIPNSPLVI